MKSNVSKLSKSSVKTLLVVETNLNPKNIDTFLKNFSITISDFQKQSDVKIKSDNLS